MATSGTNRGTSYRGAGFVALAINLTTEDQQKGEVFHGRRTLSTAEGVESVAVGKRNRGQNWFERLLRD